MSNETNPETTNEIVIDFSTTAKQGESVASPATLPSSPQGQYRVVGNRVYLQAALDEAIAAGALHLLDFEDAA